MLVPTKRFPRSGDRLNLQHPLCRGLRFLTFFDCAKPNNLGSRTAIQPTATNAPTVVTSPYGPAMRFVRGSSQRLDYAGTIMTVGTPVSCLAFAKVTVPPNNFGGQIMGNRNNATGGWLLQSVQISGSGVLGVRWLANSTAPVALGGSAAFDQWRWFGGTMVNSSAGSVCRSFLDKTVSTDTSTTITSTIQPFSIGGSPAHTDYASMDIAFAMVSEANLSQAEMRQWMSFEWPMFQRNTICLYDSSNIFAEDEAVASDDLTISTAGPLELEDDGVTGTVEAGGSVDTTPPSTGPLELSDSAVAGIIPTTVENPTAYALSDSAAAASVADIPNPLSVSDNAFAGSKATTILNSNPGILAEGRYRG